VLERDGAQFARAEKHGFWNPRFEVQLGSGTFTLKPGGFWGFHVILLWGELELGRVDQPAW
jgi:hypothetical protein